MGNIPTCCHPDNSKGDITLLMLGLDNAGKTTTVKNFLKEAVEDVVPTVGFSVVEMTFKKHKVTIFDLGGGASIRGIWKNYFALVHGVIFVVDSSATERLEEIKGAMFEVLKDSRISGKPVLLLVNKQDIDGALNEVELCTALDVEAVINEQQCPTRVETSCAIGTLRRKRKRVKDKGIEDGFQWLLGHISDHFVLMNDRVSREISKQRELEEKEKQERLLRVQKIREERERQQALSRNSKGRCSSGEPDDDCGERDLNPFRPITDFQDRAERKASVGGPRIIHVTPAVSPEVDSLEQETLSLPSEQEDKKQRSISEDGSDTTLILVHEPPHTPSADKPVAEASRLKKKKKKVGNKIAPSDCPTKASELPPLRWEHSNGSANGSVQGGWTATESDPKKKTPSESPEKDMVQQFSVADSLTSLSLAGT